MKKAMAVVLALSGSAMAQSSVYYVTNGDQQVVCAVQNGVEINRWSTGLYSYPIAVSNGQVRVCDGQGYGAQGQAYDLNGNSQGALQQRAQGSFMLDSTSDGKYNYYWGDGTIYRTDLDWGNVTPLFSANGFSFGGITWDGKNNTLWTTDYYNSCYQYDFSGNLVSSFAVGQGDEGLAWEPATDTLWMYTQGSNQFRQYDKSGNLLQTVPWNNPFGDNVIGGEFETTAIPAPGAAALLGVGGLMASRRRR